MTLKVQCSPLNLKQYRERRMMHTLITASPILCRKYDREVPALNFLRSHDPFFQDAPDRMQELRCVLENNLLLS